MRRRLPLFLAAHLVATAAIAACMGSDPAPLTPEKDGGPTPSSSTTSGTVPTGDGSTTCPTLTTFAETRAYGIDAIDGGLVVTDPEGHAVRRVESDGTVVSLKEGPASFVPTRVFERQGAYLYLDQGPSQLLAHNPDGTTTVVITAPNMVALGGLNAGPVYIARAENCGVFRRVSTDDLVLVAGSDETSATKDSGCPGLADGTRNQARFGNDLGDIEAADAALYIADRSNHCVRVIDISNIDAGANVSTLAGGSEGRRDGIGDAASFSDITGLTVDPVGHVVYVADGNRVRAIDADGNVKTIAGGEGCEGQFTKLGDLTYADGALYLADGDRIRKLVLTP